MLETANEHDNRAVCIPNHELTRMHTNKGDIHSRPLVFIRGQKSLCPFAVKTGEERRPRERFRIANHESTRMHTNNGDFHSRPLVFIRG
jgi:hypothetical protein